MGKTRVKALVTLSAILVSKTNTSQTNTGTSNTTTTKDNAVYGKRQLTVKAVDYRTIQLNWNAVSGSYKTKESAPVRQTTKTAKK